MAKISELPQLAVPAGGELVVVTDPVDGNRTKAVPINVLARPALLPTEIRNGGFDPALAPPRWAFGGAGAPAIVAADPVFQARGIARAARVAAGAAMYLEAEPTRALALGDWLAASLHVAVPNVDAWASLTGRLAVKLIPAGGSYAPGGFTDVPFDALAFEAIDATHRRYALTFRQPLAEPVVIVALMTNLGGLGFGVDVGAPAFASAVSPPAGVDWSKADPLGVQALAARVTGAAPSVHLAGDSLVDGAGATDADHTLGGRLAYYLGSAATWLGVPGSYSGQIVDREVGVPLTLANNRLDSSGTTTITHFRGRPIVGVAGAADADGDGFPDWAAQPLTSAATGRVFERRVEVAGVECIMRRTGTPTADGQTTGETYQLVYPPLTGANVFVSANQLTARTEPPVAGIYGAWLGTNDRFKPDAVVANATRWFAAHAGRRRFLIAPLCAADDPLGSTLGERTREIARRLGEICGPYAIDMLSGLLACGLRSQGMQPTGDDFQNVAAGIVPARLRADPLHLNDAGYDAAAQLVVRAFVAWGWVRRDQLAHLPPLLA